MSINSRIQTIEEHIENAYNILEIGGTDPTSLNKNITNINNELKNNLKNYLANGTETIWNNWEKISQTNIVETTLNNTIKAKMNVEIKGHTNQRNNILPNEYQQVDYIEFSGEQFFDTGIAPTTNDFGVEAKIITYSNYINKDQILCGSRDSSGNRFFIYSPTSSSTANKFGIGWNTNTISNTTMNTNTKYLIEFNVNSNKKAKLNNVEIMNLSNAFNGNNYNIYIGCSNSTGSKNSLFWGKIEYLKITNSTNLIRYFIPCYRKIDNVIGMYDLINDTFYINEGQGTFNKGADTLIPNPEYPQIINNVTENNNIIVCAKNIFTTTNNFISKTSGIEIYTEQPNSITIQTDSLSDSGSIYYKLGNISDFIGKTLTFSIGNNNQMNDTGLINCNETGTEINVISTIGAGTNITTAINNNYSESILAVRLKVSSGSPNTTYNFDNIQVEIKDSATSFEQYQNQLIIFPLSSGQKMFEGDYLADDGIHHVRGQKILKGTENWSTIDSQNTENTFYIASTTIDSSAVTNTNIKCNIASQGTVWSSDTPNIITLNMEYAKLRFRISNTLVNSVDAWKTWLSTQYNNNTPVIIEYDLKNPSTEPYTAAQQAAWDQIKKLKSYDEQTNIFQTTTNLPFKLNITALTELN